MEPGFKCNKTMVYGTIFMKRGGVVAVCIVLLAIGGCPPARESSQQAAFDDGLVSKREAAIPGSHATIGIAEKGRL